MPWFKGNLHTHTTNSDGDSPPDEVAGWYRGHGYDFLAFTDHDRVTAVEDLNEEYGGEFLLLAGEELSAAARWRPVHINGFGLKASVAPRFGISVTATVSKNVRAARRRGALTQWNHPQLSGVADPEELKSGVPDLIEVFNGGHWRDPIAPKGASAEAIWERLLGSGRRVWATAADDAHRFKQWSDQVSNPGRGWVFVDAPELTEQAVLGALRHGDFYASTGITLERVERSDGLLEVDAAEDIELRFWGRAGELLEESVGRSGGFRLRADDAYVRATARDGAGTRAWTQPVFAAK